MSVNEQSTYEQSTAVAQEIIDRRFRASTRTTVLEAGCGNATRLRLPRGARLVGIDISPVQLSRNMHLDQAILGDIQDYEFAEERFDLVICWNVLEHLPNPSRAVVRLGSVLAPGGLMVIAGPVPFSIKGLVARLTPFAAHRWFYRLMGDKRPSSELDQFPTYLRPTIAPRRLRELAHTLNLVVRYCSTFEGPVQRDFRTRFPRTRFAFAFAGAVASLLSRGRYNPNHSDAILVFERPGAYQRMPDASVVHGAERS